MAKLKYTATALISVALIGSLAFNQVAELKGSPKTKNNILTSISSKTINIDEDEAAELESDEVAELVNRAGLPEGEYTKDDVAALISEKSKPADSYVYLTSGQLAVHESPSDESNVVKTLDATDEVKVLESTEGWYKISSGDVSGYVHSDQITESKEEADFGAKYYDNYALAKVVSKGSAVNVRAEATTNSGVIEQLEPGSEVVLLFNEGDFVKICYNDSYDTGYMTDDCLELTGEFISHQTVLQKQSEVANKRAEEAAKKAAEEKAQKEAAQKKAASKKSSSKASSSPSTTVSGNGSNLVSVAARYLGTRYVYGGAKPGGFDCSGLVQYCLKQCGYSIARTASAQSGYGTSVSLSNIQPGDLLFFANKGGIHHVGIYAGNGMMIHAPHTGDVVKYSSINTSYRSRELVAIKRIFK